jgi:hypothetical protein
MDDGDMVGKGLCRPLQIGERRQRLVIGRVPVEILFLGIAHPVLPWRVTLKIGIDFRKDHAQNLSVTASFARPKGRAALQCLIGNFCPLALGPSPPTMPR